MIRRALNFALRNGIIMIVAYGIGTLALEGLDARLRAHYTAPQVATAASNLQRIAAAMPSVTAQDMGEEEE